MDLKTLKLEATCRATRIPSGDSVNLTSGTELVLTQALGDSITVRGHGELFRIEATHLEAFGEEAASALRARLSTVDVSGQPFSEEQLWTALRQCFDPEIPVNIVDLGLIYDLLYSEVTPGQYAVEVTMTLTAPGCGMGPTIANDARRQLEALPTVARANVNIVWDPQWTPHMISPAGRQILGLA